MHEKTMFNLFFLSFWLFFYKIKWIDFWSRKWL